MATFKIDLDQQTYEKLLTIALRERRPTRWQAEVMLTQAVTQDEGNTVGGDVREEGEGVSVGQSASNVDALEAD